MNNQNDSPQSLEEMVFEHRNKSYGAYVIRRQYGNTMKRAMASMFCVAAFFAGGMTWNMQNQEASLDEDFVVTPVTLDPNIEKPKEPEKTKPAEAVKPPEQPKSPVANNPVYSPTQQAELTDPPVIKDTASTPPVAAVAGGSPNANPGGAGSGPAQPADTTGTVVPPPPPGPVTIADVAPDCKGLRPYLMSSLRYPQIPKEEGIQGTVVLSFVVDTNGDVKNLAVEKGVHPALDKEALRVARGMPKWIPAITKGHKVSFLFRLPIKFRLD
ncbi:MAG: periplasmic protein TonB [Bacteroidetes bacterium]|nr:MAG: periplasmic protein TonB [Bacteroidota bacterium]